METARAMKRGVPYQDVSCKFIPIQLVIITYCSICKFALDLICLSVLSNFKESTIVGINEERTTVIIIVTT